METVFDLSSSWAPILAGIVIVPAAAAGTVLGSWYDGARCKNLQDTVRCQTLDSDASYTNLFTNSPPRTNARSSLP